jgi:formate dehydrogenase alpha subunit
MPFKILCGRKVYRWNRIEGGGMMTDYVTFTLDGQEVTSEAGKTIFEAAQENNIYIPNLCNHPDLEPVGVCRLCIVEIDGRRPAVSCKTPVEDGIVVRSETPEINNTRRTTMELLVVNHVGDCLSCSQNNNCRMQELAKYFNIDNEKLKQLRRPDRYLPIDKSNPLFIRDMNKCVLCGICVRTCAEIQGDNAIDYGFRGYDTVISTLGNKPIFGSKCVSCGECIVRCPTGALVNKHTQTPSREVTTTCTYCGVGCGLLLGVRGSEVVNVEGDRSNPVNSGHLCVKGRYGYNFINHPDRLKKPLIKKNGKFEESEWDEALDLIAEKLGKYKGDEVAVLSSAKITNEENYVVQKFTRAVIGTNNIDHCARLCHAPSVSGLAQSFGSGAMTNSIAEIEDTACIFAIGTNTTSAHPVIGARMKKAVRKGAKLIVANPKYIDLCDFAHIHLQQQPGTDVALLMGMMRVIFDENLHDEAYIKEFCGNFDDLKKSLEVYNLEFVEKTTGVPKEKIIEAARMYATNKPGGIFYAMGITQHSHGTDNVLATSNLALITGNVGKPSAGVNPLRGQNNVQGACDMGALPNVYPGYQKVADESIRNKFQDAWGCELSAENGLTHVEIFNAMAEGKIKAMYQVGENPVLSEADANHVKEALERIEFLVVQDIFMTESAEYADVVLPAASFAEKDGTFTNTERRVQRVRTAIPMVGDSRSDWWITCEIAKRMGAKGFEYSSPVTIMREIAELTPSYGGINYERIDKVGLHWPCPTVDHPGTPILHTEQFITPSCKGMFMALEYKPPAEEPDDEYPLILTTDRSLYHYHTSTMTRRVEGLKVLDKEELLRINPSDAGKLSIEDGEIVEISSRRGKTKVKANITEICPPGVVSMTFHFFESPTNELTNAALDPLAKIPETKVCAVKVQKINE